MLKYNLPVEYSRLTWGERRTVREQYVHEQNGKCFWCDYPLDGDPPEDILRRNVNWNLFPPNFDKNPIHLQHDHGTDLTEGAVHMYCNAVMWQFYGR